MDLATVLMFLSKMTCAPPDLAADAYALSNKIFDDVASGGGAISIGELNTFISKCRTVVWDNIQRKDDSDSAKVSSVFMMIGVVMENVLFPAEQEEQK